MKVCSKCHKDKPLTEYYKTKRHKSGYFSCCKDCWREKVRKRDAVKIMVTPGALRRRRERFELFKQTWNRDIMTPAEIIADMERKVQCV